MLKPPHYTPSEIDSQGHPLEEWKRHKKFSRKYYALIALASGICFGNQVFLLQVVVYSQMQSHGVSFVLFLPVFVGYMVTSFIYHLKEAVKHRQKYGCWWSKRTSVYFNCGAES